MATLNLTFKVGDKVNIVLLGRVLATGEIIEIRHDPKLKPYAIRDLDGNEKYAHQDQLEYANLHSFLPC